MPIPTEQVGSLPRSTRLQNAILAYDADRISHDALVAEQDEACADTIRRLEATGSPQVSDGEQRKSSFATYPLADTLAGKGLADKLAPGGQDSRSSPTVTGASSPSWSTAASNIAPMPLIMSGARASSPARRTRRR